MRVIELEIAEDSQPQGQFEPSQDFAPKFLWVGPARTRLIGSRPFDAGTYSGTETSTAAGIALAHNGSSQHENWVVTEPNSYPVIVGGSFVVTQTSTANQTAVGIGGATSGGSLYGGVGQYTAATVGSWLRMAIGGVDAAINGPTAVVGQRYNVVRVSRSAADHVMYVNGVRYSSTTSSGVAGDSWKNFSIGASVQNATPVFYGRQSVHLGFFDRVDPGEEWMRNWSLNEWSIFEPQTISIAVTSSGGGVTISAGIGAAVADGASASVYTGSVIGAGVGNAAADGVAASLLQGVVISTGVGAAVADGSAATVTNSAGGATISATVGNAVADGALADLSLGTTVSATAGNAVASGSLASVSDGTSAGFTKYFDVLSGQLLILRAL